MIFKYGHIMLIIVAILLILFAWPRQNRLYREIDNFLTHDECDELIHHATQKGLVPSTVYSADTDNMDKNFRISDQTWLKISECDATRKLAHSVSSISGKPSENFEEFQVVKYGQGGFFTPHYDACDGDESFCKRMNGNSGQRYMTFLVYLNDDFKGGETVFPKLDGKIEPKKGKALVFFNTDENGNLLRDSLHGGNPVDSGTKWICNVWVRINKI
jgi:prolyl 4-hydroxylase